MLIIAKCDRREVKIDIMTVIIGYCSKMTLRDARRCQCRHLAIIPSQDLLICLLACVNGMIALNEEIVVGFVGLI